MRWLLGLVLAVSGAAGLPAAESAGLESGTLLFLENCNSVVKLATRGEIGHVALVFRDDEAAWVYEATPDRVRRCSLAAYYEELGRLNKRRDDDDLIRVWALRPGQPYGAEATAAMRTFLDAQLGRRYSVKNYVRGETYDGIHCAELASNTLNRSGRYAFEDCHRIHPQALYNAVLATHERPAEIAIALPTKKESWWTRTRRRSDEWFTWCGWSCQEAWLMCW